MSRSSSDVLTPAFLRKQTILNTLKFISTQHTFTFACLPTNFPLASSPPLSPLHPHVPSPPWQPLLVPLSLKPREWFTARFKPLASTQTASSSPPSLRAARANAAPRRPQPSPSDRPALRATAGAAQLIRLSLRDARGFKSGMVSDQRLRSC